MKCFNCGHEIDESRFSKDITYCPYCGDEIGSENNNLKIQFCPYCGKELMEHTNFCPHCGKKLSFIKSKRGIPNINKIKNIQQVCIDFMENTAKPLAKKIRNVFGRERKVKKLYKQWAQFSELPPEEVPSIDKLKGMSAAENARQSKLADDSSEEE